MVVKFKKLVENAVIPTKAHLTDAGADLVVTSVHWDTDHNCYMYGTGIATEIPEGYVGLVFPRSSNRKTQYYMPNSVGVIDSGYRGEIIVCMKRTDFGAGNMPYVPGDRVAQLIIIPYPEIEYLEVEELEDSTRGAGGFGSTGK